MKIFYTASIHNFLNVGESAGAEAIKIARDIVPELLRTYTNGKLVTYFADGAAEDEHSVSSVLADIRSADAFVGEMSLPSQTLGFELAYANLHFVPSLYLYHAAIPQVAPEALITKNPTRKLWVRAYEEGNLEHVIKGFIQMVERQMETARTSFMSTKEIDTFIGEMSDTKGVPKGEVIRQILGEAAKKTDR